MKKKQEVSLVRSSAAEYLTFVAASGQGGVEAIYADESIWLTQKMMGLLYDVETHTINYHLKKVFSDSELEEGSVIRKFRITAADGKSYHTRHYNLAAIIAVGYKVNPERAVQFRKWATGIIEQFTIKAYVMDDERIKSGGSILTEQYFEEQLQRIREIRLSERKFYQKITDIYATSIDYDVTAQATKRFFATVQNKLHWAIHGQTAAEIVYHRADAEKANMGLTTWAGGRVRKQDVTIAKNYLSREEIEALDRIVVMYLDYAEDQAQCRRTGFPLSRKRERVAGGRERARTCGRHWLTHAGKLRADVAEKRALERYERFDATRREAAQLAADAEDMAALEQAERALEGKGPGKKK